MNPEAFEHLDALYSYAMRLTRNPDQAEDLVQETYENFLKRYGKKSEIEYVKALLFRIMHNRFVDEVRSQNRAPKIIAVEAMHDNWEAHAIHDRARDPRSRLLREALSDEVETALDALNPDMRETLILHEIEQFSYEEIAEIMDCSMGTVASRLARARKTLAESLFEFASQRNMVDKTTGTHPTS